MTTRFLGTTDDVTTCECCGRTNLKNTVALLMGEADEPVFYGVVCAAKALRISAKDVRKGARDADKERRAREAAERDRAALLAFAADQAVLEVWFPELAGNRFEQTCARHASGRTFADVRAARRRGT
jgi:hypothetical protein